MKKTLNYLVFHTIINACGLKRLSLFSLSFASFSSFSTGAKSLKIRDNSLKYKDSARVQWRQLLRGVPALPLEWAGPKRALRCSGDRQGVDLFRKG